MHIYFVKLICFYFLSNHLYEYDNGLVLVYKRSKMVKTARTSHTKKGTQKATREVKTKTQRKVEECPPHYHGVLNPKHCVQERQFLKIVNREFSNQEEIAQMKLQIKKQKLSQAEQLWVDTNMNFIIDFMGDSKVWKTMIPEVELFGVDNQRSSTRIKSAKILAVPSANFSGSHWTARKANESTVFDPYDEYQIYGTNQFCQTYAMMYLLDRIPAISTYKSQTKSPLRKYYQYTKEALLFIKDVIENHFEFPKEKDDPHYHKNYHLNRVKNCIENSYACLNVLEFTEDL